MSETHDLHLLCSEEADIRNCVIADKQAQLEEALRDRDEAEQQRKEALSLADAGYAKAARGEKMLREAAARADAFHRGLVLIAEDCEAWLRSESDQPSAKFIRLVAKFAREVLDFRPVVAGAEDEETMKEDKYDE